jgi:hypothetical protein
MRPDVFSNMLKTVGLILLALLLVTLPTTGALAQCPNDWDCDGLSDSEESTGITLYPCPSYAVNNCQEYYGPCSGGDRNTCLDMYTPDLFVMVVTGSDFYDGGAGVFYTSNIPDLFDSDTSDDWDYFQVLRNSGLTPHLIDRFQVPSSRTLPVASGQKAVKVIEKLDKFTNPSTDALGKTPTPGWGTPNQISETQVFTRRIVEYIDYVCGHTSVTGCYDDLRDPDNVHGAFGDNAVVFTDTVSGGNTFRSYTLDDLDKIYIGHTIAHEIGHDIALRFAEDRKLGHHYSVRSRVVLSEAADYTFDVPKKGTEGPIIWNIPRDFGVDTGTWAISGEVY